MCYGCVGWGYGFLRDDLEIVMLVYDFNWWVIFVIFVVFSLENGFVGLGDGNVGKELFVCEVMGSFVGWLGGDKRRDYFCSCFGE